MPGKVKVKIIAGRNLPVMDRSSDTTDAYVEIKLGNTTYKTDVCRKSLNPQWNSEWYRFEVDDSELQDEPLQIRLMDHDTYSANDAIGKVYMNLNPLLIPAVALPGKYGWSGETTVDQPSSTMMSGWIPVYDTMHGIRGEVNVTVKVELFSDFNKFRQSSCGVQFFCSPVIPHGYHAQVIHGFIEELVVNDDPEYQWIDKIRTPRASNEARQTLFFKLSGELQRKIGVKALDLGGNAVIGYNQCFDLEGESGIVARGIGTVVTLVKHHEMQQQLDIGIAEEKALSYLKFLAFDNGLKLESDNIFERFSLSHPYSNRSLPSSLFIPPTFDMSGELSTRRTPRRNTPLFIRQSSQPLIEFDSHSPHLKTCISSRSLSDDIKEEIALRQMLQQEDMRGATPKGLSRKIKNLKQNVLSKKMNALKARLSDTPMPEQLDLEASAIGANVETAPIRTSLIDLRELRKKKKSKLQNNKSYMAELLVRSVMHVHTSLDCIVECHDSGQTLSSSTSKLNEELGEGSSQQSIESQNTVLECDAVTGLMTKTISEPYLLLPDNTIVTQSSNASSSSEISSSSDVSESPSDSKDDKLDFDTVSLIVKNVQEEEEKHDQHRDHSEQLHFSYLGPSYEMNNEENTNRQQENETILPTYKEKKMSLLFRSHVLNYSIDVPATAPALINDKKPVFQFPADIDKKIEKLSHSALFNNSISRKRGKMNRGLSKSCEELFASSALDENVENIDLVKTEKHLFETVNTITPPLTNKMKIKFFSDDLQTYAKSKPNVSEDLIKTAVHTILMEKINLMTSQNAPMSPRANESLSQSNPDLGNKSLIKTAMQTMLMEKVNLMTSQRAPVLRRVKEEFQSNISKTFSQSNPDLHSHSLIKSAMHTIHKVHFTPHLLHKSKIHKSDPELRNHNSMKHILMDKIHFLTHVIPHKSKEEFNTHAIKTSLMNDSDLRHHEKHSSHPTFLDKIHALTSKSPHLMHKSKIHTSDPELRNHSSVKHIIMDKIHLLAHVIPHKSKEEFNTIDVKASSSSDPDLRKLEKHANHTTLMNRIHALTSKSPHLMHKSKIHKSDPELRNHSSVKHNFMDKIHLLTHAIPHKSKEEFNTNDIKALSRSDPDLRNHETHASHTLMNKFHALTKKSPSTSRKFAERSNSSTDPILGDHTLIKTAMQTMLLDKVHILTSNTPPVSPKNEEEFKYADENPASNTNLHDQSLIKTSVQTMQIDKINIMSSNSPPVSHKSEDEFQFDNNKEHHHRHSSDLENHSLIKTAMATMLIDKVNILSPSSPPVSHKNDEEFKFDDSKHSHKHEHPNLDKVKTVVQSVLDKVHIHIQSPKTPLSPKTQKEFDFEINSQHKNDELDLEHKSLTKTAMQTMLLDKVQILAPNSPPISSEPDEFEFVKDDSNNSKHQKHDVSHDKQVEDGNNTENQNLVKTAMQTMLMEKVNIVTPKSATLPHPIKELTEATQSSSKNESIKKHSFFRSFKKKCKSLKITSPKQAFSKIFHKQESQKQKEQSAGKEDSVILMDRINNMKGIITSSENNNKEETITSCPEHKSEYVPDPSSSFPRTCDKEKLDEMPLASTYAEEPNINIRLDTGYSCNNKTTAVTADDANCNTNAEHAPCLYTSDRRIMESPVPERETSNRERHGHQRTESTGCKMSQSPARLNAIPCIHRRSSDSDLSITPKGNSLTGSDRSGGAIPGYHHIRSTLLRPTVDNFDMMEYPFLTMSKYPPGFILHLGGAVSARSVKLLERITNIEEPETRDTWWSELRMEIRTHARALNCNAVLGYTESTSICDEVCVLSASGTAAVIALYSGELSDGVSGLPNLHKPHIPNKDLMTTSLDRTDFERDSKNSKHIDTTNTNNKITQVTESPEQEATIEFSGTSTVQSPPTCCRICHIPYSESSMSFRINMLYCSLCKMAKVPDIILATIEIPEGLPITGRGCFLQSYVCRPKRDLKGELNAKEISESLPFLEYELHRLLVNKMKVKAMNTIFGLKVRITIGERMLVGIATGTAVFLLPLPPPPLPKLIAGNATTEDKKLSEMQKLLVDTVKKNKEIYELKDQDCLQTTRLLSDTEESDDEKSNLDLGAGNKDSCVLEVDDSEDIEVINLLVEPRPPDGFHVVNTENVPGLEELEIVRNLQMFTQVWRAKIPLNQSASHFGKHFQKLLQSVYFKLRRMIPCALCDLQFRVDLPEPDEIQLTLLGMALGLGDPMKLTKYKRKNLCHLSNKEYNKKSDDELIFSLEEDQIPENSIPVISQGGLLNPQMPKHRQKSPQRFRINTKLRHTPIKERHGVDITPLSYVPGGKIERYLGYLNFFFIRETTSIREGGGLSGFVHSFITEVLAIVRAHVTALGGNAMVAYFMTECILYHNAHKNQGQCLINVGGDVVFVSYFTEDN